jgi:hypothetical protein
VQPCIAGNPVLLHPALIWHQIETIERPRLEQALETSVNAIVLGSIIQVGVETADML